MFSKKEIESLISDLESAQVERTTSITNTDKFAEAVCAFANDISQTGKSGVLLIGVHDNGKLANLTVTDELLRNLGGIRSDGNILPSPSLQVYKYNFKEGDVAVVEVLPSHFPPIRYKGKIWIRIGPRKAIANEMEERILTEKRTSYASSFDSLPCLSSTIDDLNIEIFKTLYLSKAISEEILKNDPRTLKEQLASLRFYDLKFDVPTNEGILLFGKNPEHYFFGAYIQYVKFDEETVASNILNEHKFTGDLISVLEKLNTFIETAITMKHPVAFQH